MCSDAADAIVVMGVAVGLVLATSRVGQEMGGWALRKYREMRNK